MAIYQPLNESALIKCFQGPLWVEKKIMTWVCPSSFKWYRQLCPITPHAANLCPITRHADNLSPITRHGKPLCHASVLFSTAVQLTKKAEKQRSARLARTSFIYFQLFILFLFLFEISKLLFFQFLSLLLAKQTRHLEPWNTREILHFWQPLTELSFDPFRTREYRDNCFYSLDWKEMKILSWNINGIRAARRDKSLKEVLDSLEADVICLQETKVTRE